MSRLSFNPRARDGREVLDVSKTSAANVSIHAPVMDAKGDCYQEINGISVSIHAPVMDANDITDALTGISTVSIHAPVMDAKARPVSV